jgi:hypothetical protein
VRAQRDHYWNESIEWLIGPDGEVAEPTGGSIDLSADPFDVPGAVILTATVDRYRIFSSALKPYVEATLCVGYVFGDWSGEAHPSSKQHITILAKGDWGADFKAPDPNRLEAALQPGRTYLLVLAYHRVGDFYEYRDSWDVSDGTVRANSPVTKYQAEHGLSPIEGLRVEQIGPALKHILSEPN